MTAVLARGADGEGPAARALEDLLALVLEVPPLLRAPLRTARIIALRSLLPRVLEAAPLPELLALLSRGPRRLVPASPAELERAEADVDRWLRPGATLATTCLYRALVRYVLLRELGLDVTFVMGVRTKDGELVGHAWIEHAGAPLREALDHTYARTFVHAARGPGR